MFGQVLRVRLDLNTCRKLAVVWIVRFEYRKACMRLRGSECFGNHKASWRLAEVCKVSFDHRKADCRALENEFKACRRRAVVWRVCFYLRKMLRMFGNLWRARFENRKAHWAK